MVSLLSKLSFGQELTNEIAWNIKDGRTEQLVPLIATDRINECVGVGDSKKYGYLAVCIKLNSMKSLRFFVENGADIELACADKTPLMYAAKYGQLEMARYLLRNGANPGATYRGKTALNFARQFRQHELIRLLREHENEIKKRDLKLP